MYFTDGINHLARDIRSEFINQSKEINESKAKIEELTKYVVELKKEIDELKKERNGCSSNREMKLSIFKYIIDFYNFRIYNYIK